MSKLIVEIHYRDTGDFFHNGKVISETEDTITVCPEDVHGSENEYGVLIFRKDKLTSLSGLLCIESSFFVLC